MTKPTPTKPWYRILLVAREVAAGGVLTARTLGSVLELTPRMASGWLSKFVTWGYATRAGAVAGPGRWERRYELTDLGRNRKDPAWAARFVRLPKGSLKEAQ